MSAYKKILKMKRLFNPRKKSEGEPQEPANTLDRIVKDKEGVKKRLEEEGWTCKGCGTKIFADKPRCSFCGASRPKRPTANTQI